MSKQPPQGARAARPDATVDTPIPRFWLPHDAARADQEGFLDDAAVASEDGPLRTTADLVQVQALVLLGEPGIGKSFTLKQPQLLAPPGALVVRHDLAALPQSKFEKDVLNDTRVKQWQRGGGDLCLVLDSVDETRSWAVDLEYLLSRALAKWPVNRLHLRVASRTADWPTSLDAALAEVFGDELRRYEMQRLRRRDLPQVLGPLAHLDRFLALIDEHSLAPLASSPLTAGMLGAIYERSATLPDQPAELYRRAMTVMCEEPDPRRRYRRPAEVTPSDRVAVARRIAAMTAFGNRPAVWTGSLREHDETDLSVDAICGDHEPNGSARVEVNERTVRSALSTALFSGRGHARLGWAHSTFEEFLSADWLVSNLLSGAQVRPLLVADDGRLYPPMIRTAAWAVAIDPDRMAWLVDRDPTAFVGRVTLPTDGLRAKVVQALFDQARRGSWDRPWLGTYRGLRYASLEDDVRPLLCHDVAEVGLALALVEDCSLSSLASLCVDIALDTAAPRWTRTQAVRAAASAGGDSDHRRLLPLLASPSALANDLDDAVLGAVLRTCWPRLVPTSDVFAHVRRAKRRSYYGDYQFFLHELGSALHVTDLPAALDWLAAFREDEDDDEDYHLQRLADRIVELGLDQLHEPKVAQSLGAYARRRVVKLERVLREPPFGEEPVALDSTRRRQLLVAVLQQMSDDPSDGALVAHSDLAEEDDFCWLVEKLLSLPLDARPPAAAAAEHLLNPSNPAHAACVSALPPTHPLHDRLTARFAPLLADETDPRMRELAARQAEHRRRKAERAASQADHLRDALVEIEGGRPAAFVQVASLMNVVPGSSTPDMNFPSDLTTTARWSSLPDETHRRVVAAAKAYLYDDESASAIWEHFPHPESAAGAAYRALHLLLRLDPDALPALPGEVWRIWAPAIVGALREHDPQARRDRLSLFARADEVAPGALQEAIVQAARHAITTETVLTVGAAVHDCWSPTLGAELVGLVRTSGSPANAVADLLSIVTQLDCSVSRPLLTEWIRADAGTPLSSWRARLAFRLLLAADSAQSWPAISAYLRGHAHDARSAITDLAHQRFKPDCAPAEVAELCLWLHQEFAPAPIADAEMHVVSPEEAANSWRSALQGHLAQMGTTEAADAVAWLADKLPEDESLPLLLGEARKNSRNAAWSPTDPGDLIAMTSRPGARLVSTPRDLVDATLDAFEAIQRELHGITPASPLLWNGDTHKSENEVTNYLANELRKRLSDSAVLVNREVEVRARATGVGERLDLQITTTAQRRAIGASPEPLTLIAEVKGAWNHDLISSIQTQLVDRYMTYAGATQSLYIVAWFGPKFARFEDVEALQAELDAAAARASTGSRRITPVVIDFTWPGSPN